MVIDDADDVATCSAHEEGDNASTKSRFVVRKTVTDWDIAKYGRLYRNALNARRFGAIFSGGQNFMMFVRMEVRRDTDISAWNRKWTSAGECCASMMGPVGRFDTLSFVTRMKSPMFALCVGPCLEQ